MLEKIISGGQTGADQGGLEAGKELGLEIGGTAPAGFRTEAGLRYDLLRGFGLVEGPKYTRVASDYKTRTRLNALHSDGTIVFGDFSSPGTRATIDICKALRRPLFRVYREDNPVIEKQVLLNWLEKNSVQILNVAGNRESKNPGLQERVKLFLTEVLRR